VEEIRKDASARATASLTTLMSDLEAHTRAAIKSGEYPAAADILERIFRLTAIRR
jgi:hypothetical protein